MRATEEAKDAGMERERERGRRGWEGGEKSGDIDIVAFDPETGATTSRERERRAVMASNTNHGQRKAGNKESRDDVKFYKAKCSDR